MLFYLSIVKYSEWLFVQFLVFLATVTRNSSWKLTTALVHLIICLAALKKIFFCNKGTGEHRC